MKLPVPVREPGGSMHMTISIARRIRRRMKALEHLRVNWSRVAAMAFDRACSRIERELSRKGQVDRESHAEIP